MPVPAHFILPIGTQVVTRVEVRRSDGTTHHPRGAVGTIVQSPSDHLHAYRVRLLDGTETSLKRQELALLKEFKSDGLHAPVSAPLDAIDEFDLQSSIIYRCIVGSRAYGLDTADSDTDRRGVYLPPAELHWSLQGVPEQLENPNTEECYWELQKFLILALKANPNVLECLYSPLVEHAEPIARQMLDMKQAFLSKRVYQTYNGYVASQFKKLEADLRNRGQVKWKHVMHLLRLLLAGITVLKECYVPVRVDQHREKLLAIRAGQIPWPELDAWRIELHREFDAALESTTLPDRPDYERVNELLISARRTMT